MSVAVIESTIVSASFLIAWAFFSERRTPTTTTVWPVSSDEAGAAAVLAVSCAKAGVARAAVTAANAATDAPARNSAERARGLPSRVLPWKYLIVFSQIVPAPGPETRR